jgi:hypothetical protein
LADFIHAAGEFRENTPRLIRALHHATRRFPGAGHLLRDFPGGTGKFIRPA